MVQSSSKLGIPHHPPRQNLKKNPTSPYHHLDGNNQHLHQDTGLAAGGGGGRLPELKKKMKRSGSVKKASAFPKISEIQRKPIKPLPLEEASASPITPQKSAPNYMKSTTSSKARKEKERSPVTVSKTLLHLHTKHSINSPSSSSGKRKPSPVMNSERSPSLKKKKTTVRALTKVPSFKKVGICGEGKNIIRRSTCSSTMKDSKFPPYLVLDHGATEAQGTSVMKVCPYTYCSLNGHHHQPDLPPLKSFLKAKRRSLKAQKKSSKFEVAGEVSDEVQVEEDFFVEFFTMSNSDDDAPAVDLSKEDVNLAEEHDLLFDEIPDPESEFERDLLRFGDISSSGDEMVERIFEDSSKDLEDDDDDYEDDQSQSCQGTEMEWVQGLDSSQVLDVEGNLYSKDEKFMLEFEKPDQMVVKSNEIASSCTEDKELLHDLFDEDTEAATSDHDDAFEELEAEKGKNVDTSSLDCQDEVEIDELEANLKAEDAEDTHSTVANEGTAVVSAGWERKTIKEEVEDSCMECKWKIGSRRGKEETEVNEKEFNPKDPNFLPLVDEAEGEKVDLKHQMIDERRNSEEWMIDRALQQTVNKLATARKRKVALLVEAFETVSPPLTKFGPRITHQPSPLFSHNATPIQAI
ncbi:Calmodulin binding protein PICBP [Linum perenne]